MPGDGAEFSKRVPKHRRNQKPQSLNIWRQIFQKRGKQKKLFETDITPEGKEIISSFERKSSLDSLGQNIPEWPSPSHAHNLSFTHDGYIRHTRTATEMIISRSFNVYGLWAAWPLLKSRIPGKIDMVPVRSK